MLFGNKSLYSILGSSLLLTSLVLIQTINQSSFSHDFSSYIASINYLFQSGHGPYVDFWDIKPVYLFIILVGWFSVTGISLASAYALYACFILVFFFTLHLWILSTKCRIKLSGIFVILLFGIVFSNLFNSMFFPSEIIGIDLVLTAMLILRRAESFGGIFFGLTFASIAGQTKEVYLFCGFALAISLLKRNFNFRTISLAFISSNFFVFFGGYLYLSNTKALGSYLEMSKVKSEMFQIDPLYNFVKFPLLALASYSSQYTLFGYILVLSLCCFSLFVQFVKIPLSQSLRSRNISIQDLKSNHDLYCLTLVLTSIISALIWQGKLPNGHYAISLQPIVLLLVLNLLSSILGKPIYIFLFALLLVMPSPRISTITFQAIKDNTINAYPLLDKIGSREASGRFIVPVSRCLQVAYGWEAGAYYYYTDSRPCSKYFLSALISGNSELANSFRTQMITNPPSEIFYSPKGADLDVAEFEKTIFPYSRVLQNCFRRTGLNNLYKSVTIVKWETSECIKSVLQK